MEHGSVKLEMVHCLSHTNNIYAEENKTVYRHIVEATLDIQYTATIVPFNLSGNGRGSYLSLKDQLVGQSLWYQDIKDTMNFLVNQKWTGNTGFSLQEFL